MANNAVSTLIAFRSCLVSWELRLGLDVWDLRVGQGTAGELGRESGKYSETLKNVEQVFLMVSVDKRAGIPGLPSLTATINCLGNEGCAEPTFLTEYRIVAHTVCEPNTE
jgi:hypothetical protein